MLYDETGPDAEEIAAEIARAVTFRDAPARALIADPSIGDNLMDGGFVPDGNFLLKFIAADFTAGTAPKVGEKVVVYEKRFKIRTVNHRPPSAFIICAVEPFDR